MLLYPQGLCRTGKMLASDYDKIKPDMILIGKSLTGGGTYTSTQRRNEVLHKYPRSLSNVCHPSKQRRGALYPSKAARNYVWGVSTTLFQPISNVLNKSSNPLACAVAMAALDVLVEEKLADRALYLGEMLRSGVKALNHPLIQNVRGKGLLNAVLIDESRSVRGRSTWQLCLLMMSRGLLAIPTQGNMSVLIFVSSCMLLNNVGLCP
jgi:ornithine--oxo-acid transaminase